MLSLNPSLYCYICDHGKETFLAEKTMMERSTLIAQ